ncbi:hypothetical protein [Nocardioides flavescens]|uniref:hypothetical protein n=1 Tax=Nocardioides flavescens TaxID=2691959 RepID=UPI00301D7302
MPTPLPSYDVVARRRPVDLVRPGPVRAPYAATRGRGTLTLASGSTSITCDDSVALHVTRDGRTTTLRSRRHGRPQAPVDELALTLTARQVTAFALEAGRWVARARHDLDDSVPVHDEGWLAGLEASAGLGRFGQVGLRDLRVVTHADGSPWLEEDRWLLTATSAGPGGFTTGHTSVWSLDPETLELAHRADLFVRRDGGVYGDHAVHLVRDAGRWLLAASTWGDFEPRLRPVRTVLATSEDDLTTGVHVLDAAPLTLPTDGLRSVGVWDPHLVRCDDEWLVAYVSARKYFRFHPVVATGPTLDDLTLRAAASRLRETEGSTLAHVDGRWRVLASDTRRQAYPVLDLDLREVATLDAAYVSNIPWPTLLDDLVVGFDGTTWGGPLLAYGTHGDVVIQRARRG